MLAPLMVWAYSGTLALLPPGLRSVLLVVALPVGLHLLCALPLAWLARRSASPLTWAGVVAAADLLLASPLLGVYADPSTPSVFLLAPMWLAGPATGTLLVLLAGGLLGRLTALLPLAVLALACLWSPASPGAPITLAAGQGGNTGIRAINEVPQGQAEAEEGQWKLRLQGVQADLIVLPEDASAVRHTGPAFRRPFAPNVLYGAVEYDALAAYNSVFAGGERLYRKRRLVPTTETPWLTPGRQALAPVDVAGMRVGILTCVEALFALDAAQLARQGAQVLVVPASNKHPKTAQLQLAAARAAAVSAGLPLVLASEAGQSAIVTKEGRTVARGNWAQAQVVSGEVLQGHPSWYSWLAPFWLILPWGFVVKLAAGWALRQIHFNHISTLA
nr:nitrilase-related carbon-nitrogen hydrolase [Deinococcus betulae]